MSFLSFALLLPLTFSASSESPATQTQVGVDFTKLLPKDVVAYVSIHDLSTLGKRMENAGLKKFIDQPQVQEFWNYLKGRVDEMSKNAGAGPQALRDLKFKDVWEAIEGDVAVAMLPVPEIFSNKKGPDAARAAAKGFLFLLDAKGKNSEFDSIFQKLIQAVVDEGFKKEEEDYKGAKLVMLQAQKEKDVDLVFCHYQNWYGVSANGDSIKGLIRRSQDGTGDDLASGAKYAGVQKMLGSGNDFGFYLDSEWLVQGLVTAAAKEAENSKNAGRESPVETINKMAKIVGADALKALGMGFVAKNQRLQFRACLSSPGGMQGGLKAIFPPGPNARIPEFVEEDTQQFNTSRVDLVGLYDTIIAFFTTALKASGQPMDPEQLAQMMLGLDMKVVKSQIFENLTGEYFSVTRLTVHSDKAASGGEKKASDDDEMDDPTDMPGVENSAAYILPAKDGAKLTEAFSTVFEAISQRNPMMEPKVEDYIGGKLFVIGDGAFVLGIKGNYLVLGPGEMPKSVMRRIGGTEKTLAENPLFKEMSADLPGNYQSLSFQSPDAWENTFKMISPLLQRSFQGSMFDFTKLPNATAFTKQLVGTMSYSVSNNDGFQMTMLCKIKKD